eukprot:817650-Rhodomonas_salina.1
MMVYVPEKSMVYVSSSVYLDRYEFPIAEAMAQKKMQERLAAVKEGLRVDVKTRWNEGMTGVRVDEREEITPMTDAQKDRIRAMLETNLLEDLWAEADGIDRENRLPESAIGVDNLTGDEDEDMSVFDGSVDLGEPEAGPQAPSQSTTWSGKAYLDSELKQNARWNAGGGVADSYVVTEIPGVPGAIGSKDIVEEPKDYVLSQELPQALFWHAATHKELDGLKENGTYTVVDLPEGRKAIPSKLILNVKRDAYGQISKYKGRVVVQGFRQLKGVDFTHTYAPVAAS